MKRYELLKALEDINEFSDHEIAINADFIRRVAILAYGLIKQQGGKKKPK